jgi:hypothetical protein
MSEMLLDRAGRRRSLAPCPEAGRLVGRLWVDQLPRWPRSALASRDCAGITSAGRTRASTRAGPWIVLPVRHRVRLATLTRVALDALRVPTIRECGRFGRSLLDEDAT